MTQQLSIGELVTNEALRNAFSKQLKREKRKALPTAEEDFEFQVRAYKLPTYIAKMKLLATHLTPKRQQQAYWEMDGIFPDYKLIVEIQGGVWIRGAHGHPTDIVRNMAKHNDCVLLGYQILQFEPKQVKDGSAIAFTMRVLADRGWKP